MGATREHRTHRSTRAQGITETQRSTRHRGAQSTWAQDKGHRGAQKTWTQDKGHRGAQKKVNEEI